MARTGLSVCRALAMSALVACAVGFMGCGGAAGGDEVVYLHVVHGYAGAASLSVYGPEGALVTGLRFGDATAEPIAFDRANFDGTLTVVMDGVPGAVAVAVDLFTLYPQETATLFVQRRSGLSEIAMTPLRHLIFSPVGRRAPDAQCLIAPLNMLSLSGDLLPSDNTFSYMVQQKASAEIISRAYNPSLEQTIPTECGLLSITELGAEGQRIREERTRVLAQISSNPDLYPVQATDSNIPNALQYVSGEWVGGSTVIGPKTSRLFVECVAAAVQIKQEEEQPAPGQPADPAQGNDAGCDLNPLTGELTFPRDPVTMRPLLTIDSKAISECFGNSEVYQGFPITPGQFDANNLISYESTSPGVCQGEFTIRTALRTTIYDQGAGRADQLPIVKLNHPDSTSQTVILYGRPLDPLIHQFTNAERSEVPGNYPGDKGLDPNTREDELPGRDITQ